MTEVKSAIILDIDEKLSKDEDKFETYEMPTAGPLDLEAYSPSFNFHRIIMKLPPSAKFVMYLLKLKGALNRKKIIQQTIMPDRTVGFALKLLLELNLIRKEFPSEMRQKAAVKGRRRRRIDRRITNYTLVSKISPLITVDS